MGVGVAGERVFLVPIEDKVTGTRGGGGIARLRAGLFSGGVRTVSAPPFEI